MVRSQAVRFLWVPIPGVRLRLRPRVGLWSLSGEGPAGAGWCEKEMGDTKEVRRLVRRALAGRLSGVGQWTASGRPGESDPPDT